MNVYEISPSKKIYVIELEDYFSTLDYKGIELLVFPKLKTDDFLYVHKQTGLLIAKSQRELHSFSDMSPATFNIYLKPLINKIQDRENETVVVFNCVKQFLEA